LSVGKQSALQRWIFAKTTFNLVLAEASVNKQQQSRYMNKTKIPTGMTQQQIRNQFEIESKRLFAN